ncbi:MAG: DUF3365 domain-containing protein [Proteobacteria bacterium]|nr:DUF3365 domain-containing protein [Pseudomonadota bacterium]
MVAAKGAMPMRLKPHSLQNKFLAGLGLVMAAMVAFFAVTLSMHLGRLMESEAREKAALILSQVEAVQRFVRTQLRPAMYRVLPESQFVLEAMSTSYVTRSVMSDLNLAKDSFTYRRVGIGARNPDYEANHLEQEIIHRFEADHSLVRVEEFVKLDGERHFVTARPQRFEASCLHCHGDPKQAPKELLERYGAVRGFGRKVGELAGIDLVRLKVERDVGGIRDATLSFATFFAVGILVLFLVIQGFFHRLVVQSLRRVTGVMHRIFPEEAPAEGPPVGAPPASLHAREDEIEDILHGFEAFAEHLRQARQDLKDYAATLEDKVADRTVELTRQAEERRADVALFVSLLNSLNESQAKPQLLAAALALVAGRFKAARAAYVCVLSASDYAAWPDPKARPELPADWHELVSAERPRFTPLAWYIPVQTNGTSRGILCLFWDAEQESSDRQADLAQAIGQQLGIAMENLDALDGLLRQNETLSSIFEGIADPLLLLDASASVLLANTTAQRLAAEIAAGGASTLPALIATATGEGGPGEFELPDDRIFEASLYQLESPGGRRSVAYLREVTAQRRMEGRMRQNERLVAVGQLAAGLAHEINNPLGVILCYAELLRPALSGPGPQADLDVILRHTGQAQRVVRDLLDFARPRPASTGPSSAADVAASIIEVLRPRAKAAKVEVSLGAPPDLPLVCAGADALEHILSNLLLNALDVMPEGSGRVRVDIVAEPDGRFVRLTVSDNGPGIAEEHLDRVFDPFFTTKEVGKGTGLGLAVVYGLVHELGGALAVENTPEGGAAFTVRLPADGPETQNMGEVK